MLDGAAHLAGAKPITWVPTVSATLGGRTTTPGEDERAWRLSDPGMPLGGDLRLC